MAEVNFAVLVSQKRDRETHHSAVKLWFRLRVPVQKFHFSPMQENAAKELAMSAHSRDSLVEFLHEKARKPGRPSSSKLLIIRCLTDGGGESLRRTVLRPQFPAIRDKYRENTPIRRQNPARECPIHLKHRLLGEMAPNSLSMRNSEILLSYQGIPNSKRTRNLPHSRACVFPGSTRAPEPDAP